MRENDRDGKTVWRSMCRLKDAAIAWISRTFVSKPSGHVSSGRRPSRNRETIKDGEG